ncbi:MAG: hypothetical protein WCG25_07580 [bacterium]
MDITIKLPQLDDIFAGMSFDNLEGKSDEYKTAKEEAKAKADLQKIADKQQAIKKQQINI